MFIAPGVEYVPLHEYKRGVDQILSFPPHFQVYTIDAFANPWVRDPASLAQALAYSTSISEWYGCSFHAIFEQIVEQGPLITVLVLALPRKLLVPEFLAALEWVWRRALELQKNFWTLILEAPIASCKPML